MEDTKRDRKKEKQKTDETRNNLGKAWVAYKGVCAGSLQEFVNHLLAVHELYCNNSRDRQRQAQMGEEEGEDVEDDGDRQRTRSPLNRNSRPSRDDQSSLDSQPEDLGPQPHHHHHHRGHRSKELPRSDTSTHSEGSHLTPRHGRVMLQRSPGQVSRSRSRSISRGRQPIRRGMSREMEEGESEGEDMDEADGRPSGSMGGGFDRPPIGVCITNLPVRSTDSNLKDGLYHKYKKHGKIQSVHITGEGEDRYAVISFQRPDEAKKALSEGERVIYGAEVTVNIHQGYVSQQGDNTDYIESDCSEYHVKATRTLFIRNLEEEIRIPDLRDIFQAYGEILDIDIKRQSETNYAFIQYTDILSVVRARRDMEGKMIGSLQIQTGFGKSLPSKTVWLDNVAEQVSDKYLCQKFSRYGPVTQSLVDHNKTQALIFFESVDTAQYAVNEMRGRVLYSKKIMIDFASQVSEQAFVTDLERSGGMAPGRRMVSRGSRGGGGSAHFAGRDGYAMPPKGRPGRMEGGEPMYGYNNMGQQSSRGRPMATTSRSNNQGSSGSRMARGGGSRTMSFHERIYQPEPETRERRPTYYSDHGPEPPLQRENSYDDMEYSYRRQEPRGISPPRKRRMVQGEVRTSRPMPPSREPEARYSKQYADQYHSPLQRERRESYADSYGHFGDGDNQSGGRREVGPPRAAVRYTESHREYREPEYDEKSEDKLEFSPAHSGSDVTNRSPSPDPDGDEL